MSATPSAVLDRWSQALDDLESGAPADLPGTLPPELEHRAREVLAHIIEASQRVAGQMAAVRTELASATPRRNDAAAAPRASTLDVDV